MLSIRVPRLVLLLSATLLSSAALAIGTSAGPESTSRPGQADDRRWKERLPDADRTAVESGIGFGLPDFAEDLVWVGGKAPFESMEELAGRVLVIQSWTSGTSRGRKLPARVARNLRDFHDSEDVVVVLLHTPQDAEGAEEFCEGLQGRAVFPMAVDASGATCDLIGAFKLPVNVVVDREGEVRYAGLHDRGLRSAVEKLIAEPHAPDDQPTARAKRSAKGDGSSETSAVEIGYPAVTGKVGPAIDLRGMPAPEFFVQRWISPEPDARGKVAIVDFWATWCGPCIKAIPHMNSLAQEFRGQVECVGVSDESPSQFMRGLEQRSLDGSKFAYSLALDSSGRMKNAFGIRGIPHVAVMSTDWVVRWQGHPSGLTRDIVRQIVEADPGVRTESEDAAATGWPPTRWGDLADDAD